MLNGRLFAENGSMPATTPKSLPQGLPAHLCVGNEGYQSLCTLLGITTTRVKQEVVNVPAAKRFLGANRGTAPRHGRQAERLRRSLLALYSDPDTRLEVWEAHGAHIASGKNGRSPIPSLEHEALSAYDHQILTAEPDPERLADCNPFHTDGQPDDAGRRNPALAALPQIKDDFTDWAAVPPDRKPRVIAAAFAVASLLDDPRILNWAAARESDIEREYAFLDSTEQSESPVEPATEVPADDTDHGALPKLRARATALAQAAGELAASEPTDARFNVLSDRYADVLELREAVLAQTNAKAIDDQLAEFAGLLATKAEMAPWLGAETEGVLAEWRAAYPPVESDLDAIHADVDRAIAGLDASLSRAADAQAEADKAKAALDHHTASGGSSRSDIRRQAELSADVNVAFQALADATEEVLAALAPRSTEPGAARSSTLEVTPDEPAAQLDSRATQTASPAATKEAAMPLDSDAETTPRMSSSRGSEEQASPEAETPDPTNVLSRAVTPNTEQSSDSGPIVAAREQDGSSPATPASEPEAPAPSSVPPTPSEVDQGEVATAHVESTPEDSAPIPEPETVEADELSAAQASLWRAVGDGRIGLAYHIARLDDATRGTWGQPTPELLAAAALGSVLGSPHGDLANVFGGFVGPLGGLNFHDASAPTRDALNLLLFVATLRPALFSAQQGASVPLLRRVELSGGLSAVYRLATSIADYGERLQGVHLDVPTLSTMLDEGVWKDRVAAIAERASTWRDGATAATFLFAPAGYVWQHLLGKSGVLGELARLLSSERPGDAPRVREIVSLLDDRKALHGLIHETDQRHRNTHGNSIDGRALAQLENRLDEPRNLARTWLRAMQARPGGAGFVETTVEALRYDIDRLAPAALDAINRIGETAPSAPFANALRCARRAIASLASLFEAGSDAGAGASLTAVQALSDDLLRVTTLRIDTEGMIEDPEAPGDALALLIDADAHAATLAEAFNERLERGDLYGADAVCTRMSAADEPGADRSQERLNEAIATHRAALQRQLYALADSLEHAFVLGEMSETDRAELTAMISDATRRLEQHDGILTVHNDVDIIAKAIEPAVSRSVKKIKLQLDAFVERVSPREQALVESALEARDLATLHEQLDCLTRGQPLMSRGRAESRLDAFLATADRIETALSGETGPTHDALLQAVRERADILGLAFSALSPDQAERSAALLEHWFHLARHRRVEPGLVAGFLADLGLVLTNADVEPRGDGLAAVHAEPLRDRQLCPAHGFGSGARGRYNIVFNWHVQAREPIIQALASRDPTVRTIVLHFGNLTRADREWLGRWSTNQSTQFVTIDETLVLYLASLPREVLRALFDCTLPFTCAEPYFTAPGLVPPESFYGREGERNRIIDQYGSCFVYGGRQLGKTALLQTAQAAFHNPSERHVAEYVDLKARDVGIAEGPDHIWRVLWDVFTRLDVINPGLPKPRGRTSWADNTEKAVRSWLDADEDRRILLLLDEADAFLNADLRNDFLESTRLKGLMDNTNRRFKVVLCGLHNVLRNTERANHPLAHFGEPVCVGPLLENGDLEQARALVQEPMAAVGYTFENENLTTQILLWTNYYPSLIQLFAEALLRHLRQAPRREFPHTVTEDDVRAVLERNQFRDYIRNRFSLTLQLDQRYEVVTYAMAVELQGERHALAVGLTSNRILELAREYWPDGFETSEHEFRTLLQEMGGLGVLRQRSGDASSHYVFRNPNVFRLLGDADTILNVLYKEREKPVLFEASAFHAQYSNAKAESPHRGPPTYEQEALLKRGGRVAVMCGVPAANLAHIPGFFADRIEENRLRPLGENTDVNGVVSAINRLRPERETYLCLADENDPWTLHWVERTAEALRAAERGGGLRVVFRAGPDELWTRFVSDLPDEYLVATNRLFDWAPVQPWTAPFLQRWCTDLGLHEVNAKIDELLDLTGGWPMLLERYAASGEKTWLARKAEVEGYVADNHDEILDALGLDARARGQLAPLRAWETLDPNDVEACAELWANRTQEHVDASVLRRRLFWATQLGLVQDVGGIASFNPLVARVLGEDE